MVVFAAAFSLSVFAVGPAITNGSTIPDEAPGGADTDPDTRPLRAPLVRRSTANLHSTPADIFIRT